MEIWSISKSWSTNVLSPHMYTNVCPQLVIFPCSFHLAPLIKIENYPYIQFWSNYLTL
uniref:Uncharacterized protein n=1 Tax=Meloidogyne enterolobii TaxID=390850 RepID=A0A6V7V6V3_MELEN|nr:unnamed protein product [Meloidogyne enterolobii]